MTTLLNRRYWNDSVGKRIYEHIGTQISSGRQLRSLVLRIQLWSKILIIEFIIIYVFFFLQRILLHPDGKIRQTSRVRRCQKRRWLTRRRRLRIVQGAESSLQQKQSHRGMGTSGSWLSETSAFLNSFFTYYLLEDEKEFLFCDRNAFRNPFLVIIGRCLR